MTGIRKKPRQQRSRATWDAILEAAAQLFGERGYTGTTTNKVAERAGVSIGSLYQYFPNKEALLLALSERHMEESGATLNAVFQQLEQERPDLETTLTSLIEATVALHRHNPAMHRLLFEQTPRSAALMSRFRRLETLMATAVAGQLTRLGVGGPHPEARALLLVQGVEAQVHGAVLAPPEGLSSDTLVEEIKALWLTALRSGHPR
ncbi:Transcriptional regulator, TetR family [Alloalcanivorax xenomutans]|uniref:TetR/AcrR family transcriptional regulator n=1 Tax=Alloalcanivorax xenomutans TaxID=1094342 RepID=UPI0006D5CB3C|nr:TetR/AcrR family transcriptional regulator [Alloalcanivorax xenomutans]PHS65885.1 MAG: TetR/AcrR family transcriptional regulator [Alcanivorax sp.]CUR48149.1 Transcriptional regulator, TetR family [Alloalcanivorax xenomutans]